MTYHQAQNKIDLENSDETGSGQWQIQGFPDGVDSNSLGGGTMYISQIVPPKLHEMKETEPIGGVPLDLPMLEC